MGNPIVKLPHATRPYIIYSSIVDAPITRGMTLAELKTYIREKYGRDGIRDLDMRLKRVETKGTSSFDDVSARDTVAFNRAGLKETCLSMEQLVEFFCERGCRGRQPRGHKHDDSGFCDICCPKDGAK